MTQHGLVDLARVQELETEFGADDMGIVIDAFLEETDAAITGLEGLLSSTPDPDRTAVFHFLAGSALMVGAASFGALCKQLENQQEGFGPEGLAALRREFDAVRAWFNQRFASAAHNAA
ncbi:MAG: Hpt domain-containing protein [Pseudomonadota bacterium]